MGADGVTARSGGATVERHAEHPGRGGRRPGAGRPLPPERSVRSTMSLPASYWGALIRVGNGNTSAAVRQLIEDAGIVL